MLTNRPTAQNLGYDNSSFVWGSFYSPLPYTVGSFSVKCVLHVVPDVVCSCFRKLYKHDPADSYWIVQAHMSTQNACITCSTS